MVGGDDAGSILLEHARDPIALVDDGEFRYVNEASRRVLGYAPDELVGERAFDYVHPGDLGLVRAAFEAIEGNQPASEIARYRFRGGDGAWIPVESRISNLAAEGLEGYVVSSRDVTDRIEAERERERQETRLTEVTDRVDDVVWLFSGDWEELLFVNPAYEDVYGQSIETLRADPRRFLDTIHPDDRPCVEEAMRRLSAGDPSIWSTASIPVRGRTRTRGCGASRSFGTGRSCVSSGSLATSPTGGDGSGNSP